MSAAARLAGLVALVQTQASLALAQPVGDPVPVVHRPFGWLWVLVAAVVVVVLFRLFFGSTRTPRPRGP